MSDSDIKVTPKYDWSELRSGFAPRTLEGGSVELVGWGKRIDYDKDGNKTGESCKPTGCVLRYEADRSRDRRMADDFLKPMTRVIRRILRREAG